MPRPVPIRTIGLKQYLDQTAKEHNNLNYEAFCRMVEFVPMPAVAKIAHSFGVSKVTLWKWITIYREEQKQ